MADRDHDLDSGTAADTDAPWRPDYTGPEPRPASRSAVVGPAPLPPADLPDRWSRHGERLVDEASEPAASDSAVSTVSTVSNVSTVGEPAATSGRPPGLVAAGIVGLLAVVVAAVAVVAMRGGGEEGAFEIPDAVDELWSVELDPNATGDLAEGVVIVSDSAGLVRGVDARTGEMRWNLDVLDGRSPDEVYSNVEVLRDGIAIVNVRPFDSAGTTRAVDVRTGDERWVRQVAIGTDFFELGGALVEFTVDLTGDSSVAPQVRLLDPQSGEPMMDAFEIDERGISSSMVSIVDPVAPDRLALIDLEAGEIVAAGIDGRGVVTLSFVGGHTIAATSDGALVLLADDGAVLDEVEVDVGSSVDDRWLQPIVGTSVGVLSGEESVIAFEIVDDQIEIAWGMPGELALIPDRGDESILAIGSTLPNETWLRLVEPTTGDVTFSIDGDSSHRLWFSDPAAAANGLVYADGSGVHAVDREGAAMWTIDSDEVERLLVDEGLFIVIDGDRIIAYG